MMDWMLEGEDVACPVDDMVGRKWTCSRSAFGVGGDSMGEERTGVHWQGVSNLGFRAVPVSSM